MKHFLTYFLCSFFLASCTKENSNTKICSPEQVESLISALPEVKERELLIDSISKHKHGITFLTTEEKVGDSLFYAIQVGHSGEERFETYYTFYVDKNDCRQIRVLDVVRGDILPLETWRTTNTQ